MWGETSGVRSEERSHLDSYYIKGDRKGTEREQKERERGKWNNKNTKAAERERQGGRASKHPLYRWQSIRVSAPPRIYRARRERERERRLF